MRKNKIFLLIIPLVVLFVFACSDYINDVNPLIDQAQDELLNDESQIGFLTTGVKQRFATNADQIACQLDLLSDQMIYTNKIASASFPTFEEIEKGDILLENNTSNGTFRVLSELRFFADDLIRRTGVINFTDNNKKNLALFTGNLYAGIARFYMGTAFAINPNEPGGVVNAGPFIPQAQMLDTAIIQMKNALTYTTVALEKKYVNSLIAKVYFAKKDYTNAATYAALGLAKGDAAFEALHNDVSNIYYWGFAGKGRVQIAVNSRFNDYVTADPKEANRIKLGTVTGIDNVTYYWQLKYPDKFNNFPIMTWQENHLMLAECALRGTGSANALALVNEVRDSHLLDPLAAITTDGILIERDKELFCQGTRLMDQHRTSTWHLGADKWRYMPIGRPERDSNPNLPKG